LLVKACWPTQQSTTFSSVMARFYDGSGNPPIQGEVAINGERIATVGKLADAHGKREIDANGLAVAPGFINMLSWATQSLIEDGRSQSDIARE